MWPIVLLKDAGGFLHKTIAGPFVPQAPKCHHGATTGDGDEYGSPTTGVCWNEEMVRRG